MTDSRATHISDQLEDLILTGAFSNGERLNEAELSERFGVSRTPIREALQKLVPSGLIEHIPRRGAFVRQPGAHELIEMFEVMAELESICGRLAARRISSAALDQLRASNTACQAALSIGDADGYYLHNERFHFIIYEQSGNSFLCDETKALHRRLRPFRRMQLQLRGRMGQSMQEHNAVVEALEAGDQACAEATLRGHVAVQGERFNDLMARIKAQA